MENVSLKVGQYQLNLLVNQQGEEHYVALRPLCEALGLRWQPQHKRTLGNPQFKCHSIVTVAQDSKEREMIVLPVTQVGMWLCTINARRVSDEVRPQLLAFQEHLQLVIHDHLCGRLTNERIDQLIALVWKLQERVEFLEARQDAQGILSDVGVSNAGRQLAAQRKALRSIQ